MQLRLAPASSLLCLASLFIPHLSEATNDVINGNPPMVVASRSGAGWVAILPGLGLAGADPKVIGAYPNVFNSGFDLSSADVNGDGITDVVAFTGTFGNWPELRAYSGDTGALIAATIVSPDRVESPVTARYTRLIGGNTPVAVVGTGGASPMIRVRGSSAPSDLPADLRPPIPLSADYQFGMQLLVGRTETSPADFVAVAPLAGGLIELFNLSTGTRIASINVTNNPAVYLNLDYADVNGTNPGRELIVTVAGATPEVLVYTLGGTRLSTFPLGVTDPFFLKPVGVPIGQGPGGEARILVFADGGVTAPNQLLVINPSTGAVTPNSTGLFNNWSGLTGALGPANGGSEATLFIGSPYGFEATIQRTTLGYTTIGSPFNAFDSGYNGGAQVAAFASPTGAPLLIVTGPGPGAPPIVRVFSNPSSPQLVTQFFAYPPTFRGGVSVAVGDLNGDGVAEIITGPSSGSPLVRIFNSQGEQLNEFLSPPFDFEGGLNVAVGDVAEDPTPEILTTPNGPGRSVQMMVHRLDGSLLTSFQVASASFDTAVLVAVGDVDGDGRDDILAGARNTARTTGVRVFRGGELSSGNILVNFEPFEIDGPLGVSVAFAGNTQGVTGIVPRILVGDLSSTTAVRIFNTSGALQNIVSPSLPVGNSAGVRLGTIRLPEPPRMGHWAMY
jgi:hypothetical protein